TCVGTCGNGRATGSRRAATKPRVRPAARRPRYPATPPRGRGSRAGRTCARPTPASATGLRPGRARRWTRRRLTSASAASSARLDDPPRSREGSLPMNLPPWVVGIGAMIACVVAGAVLITLGFDLIGIVVALAAIPVALVAWVVANDRV